jgi:hypothetical protein
VPRRPPPLRTFAALSLAALAVLPLAGCRGPFGGGGAPYGTAYTLPWPGLVPAALAAGSTSYEGPLVGADAARRALDCAGRPAVGKTLGNPLDDGLLEGGRTPEEGLAEFLGEPFRKAVPRTGYEPTASADGRILYALPVGGRTRVAVVLVDDRDPATYTQGWGAESYAWCDASEFPASSDGERPYRIWTDRTGARMHTDRVVGYRGSAHCDETAVTFVVLGGFRGQQYLRDPEGVLAQFVHGRYAAAAKLPKGARDTGFRRAGAALWLGRNAAYVVTPGNVERLPAAKRPILCA